LQRAKATRKETVIEVVGWAKHCGLLVGHDFPSEEASNLPLFVVASLLPKPDFFASVARALSNKLLILLVSPVGIEPTTY
jgi:hypothetical protein